MGHPELFATYIELTADARAVVRAHVDTLVGQLERIILDGVAGGELETDYTARARAVFDATARFHNPVHAAEWSDPASTLRTTAYAVSFSAGSSPGVDAAASDLRRSGRATRRDARDCPDMSRASTVDVRPLDPRRLEPLIGKERVDTLLAAAANLAELLGSRRIVNINSTAAGGGVAELLATLLGYVRGIGLDADWVVIAGDPEFFTITKRIHNGLYGSLGDGGELGERERAAYERTLAANLDLVRDAVRKDDVVIVHDPQPAGIISSLVELGARVVWRCHIGYDGANEWTERAWTFVHPYVEAAHAYVFSRESFAPEWIDRARLGAIPPSIDPFTPKNEELRPSEVLGLLVASGIVAEDGVQPDARVRRRADAVRGGPPLDPRAPLVLQVSRWDRMKDMAGVLEAFAHHVRAEPAQLVLAGPAVAGVSDDPEE
jgi:trehalose synthase